MQRGGPDSKPGGIDPASRFPDALQAFPTTPLVVFHNDADGLSAGAILVKSLHRAGFEPQVRLIGKGENAYSAQFAGELRERAPGGLIIADLGVSTQVALPEVPTIIIDHHVPTGIPAAATVISGAFDDPVPTSSLLAYRCAGHVGPADDMLWLAAIGIIGDLAEGYGFAEMEAARRRYGITALRNAAALVNAPRRTATGDASAAFALLMRADGPKAVLSGEYPETELLQRARQEVSEALAEARKQAPKFSGEVALIMIDTPCQVHPIIAQQWMHRLKKNVVIAANRGYRPGWVHFAVRSARDIDILEFLERMRPEGADEQYGKGHRRASGGGLCAEAWNAFAAGLGFGSEAFVPVRGIAA